ncbi:MAG: ABC transporter substrate-binding protein [Leptolyngbyaceae cyanobacterium MO_188.B28]|nr:ABC transporter substrate-binding protein [Leptolyngbyaceae cyanobacterium MO_188.B28]
MLAFLKFQPSQSFQPRARGFLPLLLMSLLVHLGACDSSQEAATEESTNRTVTIMGVIVGEEQEKLEKALAPFEEATGIDVIYEGTDAFATVLPIRVDSGNPPDIALFPQPGLMADLAREGKLTPITTFVDEADLKTAYTQSWLDLGAVEGDIYGVWFQAAVKSLVWYRPDVFEAEGYQIPTTWDELVALTEKIAVSGKTPWCIGMESGSATGWVGTDWVEDIMLRTTSPETYDKWIRNDAPFTDSTVKQAFELFGEIALNPNYVRGGTVGILSTSFGDASTPLFDNPPGCYLHRQATFIEAFFPDGVDPNTDVDVFPLPTINADYGLPILIAGDIFAMINDTPEARSLMQYLVTVEPHNIRARLGSYISPHRQVELSQYPDTLTQMQAEILLNADVVRFDGSDMMPGAVGAGSFWMGMVDYIGGADLDTVLSSIQKSWPQELKEQPKSL